MALPQIQRFPAALLPLLSIKAGETPPELEQTVTPSLEMLAAYLADRLEVQTAQTLGVTTQNFATQIQIPVGEYWWVQSVTAIASNITVASNVQLGVAMADPANVTAYLAGHDAQHASIAGQVFQIGWDAPQPIFYRPGWKFLAGTLVAPTSLDLQLRVVCARLTPN